MGLLQWGRHACWYLHTEGNHPFLVTYRWGHYLAATAFVGLLLFLNLLLLSPGAEGEWRIGKPLLERVFVAWRWATLALFFCGLNLLHMLYNFPTGNYFDEDKGMWMAVGASLGTLVCCLVWFWIWPAQQRHFSRWDSLGGAGRELAPGAALGIRVVTVMVPPLMMGMLVGGHGITLFTSGWVDVAWTLAVGCLPVLAIYAWAARRAARAGRGGCAS